MRDVSNGISDDCEGGNLPNAPNTIIGESVDLHFEKIQPGNSNYGFVPFYHFVIMSAGKIPIGHINFRVGSTPHVLFCAGHIGYEIIDSFRGHSYAFHACETLAPFIKTIYDSVILTSDPENYASIKTIEKLGATHLGLHPIPLDDPNYKKGIRLKHRYVWKL
jgi:tagatose 1,6-diphosphate aldolase